MEEAAAVRRAALTAVEDIEPDRLAERIHDRIDDASMAPGVLTVVTAGAVGADADVTERAAGVQLIYEGLGLTRCLSQDPPWTTGRDDGDLDILIADILVARGFYLLARTEAADAAVGVVRSFGRDQTVRRETDDSALDRDLERDVLDLAVVAGVTAADAAATDRLRAWAADLASDGLPAAERVSDPGTREQIAALATADAASEGVRPSADY